MTSLPRHIAIVMDGNGRWAKSRKLPRIAGHEAGSKSVQRVIEACLERKIETLSLFAFSCENWARPKKEVDFLMKQFYKMLDNEKNKMLKNGVRLKIIGDTTQFNEPLQKKIAEVEKLTQNNSKLQLIIAANYSGKWDIVNTAKKLAHAIAEKKITAEEISENLFNQYISTTLYPEPDLFIRTSGEMRISNYMLWQLAYTELYFTETLWPDFDEAALDLALKCFAQRERRFGKVEE